MLCISKAEFVSAAVCGAAAKFIYRHILYAGIFIWWTTAFNKVSGIAFTKVNYLAIWSSVFQLGGDRSPFS